MRFTRGDRLRTLERNSGIRIKFWRKWVDTVQMPHVVDMPQMHQMLEVIAAHG